MGFERGGKYNQLIRYQYKDNMWLFRQSNGLPNTHQRTFRVPVEPTTVSVSLLLCSGGSGDRADRLCVGRAVSLVSVRCSCRLSSSFVRNSIKIYLSGAMGAAAAVLFFSTEKK